MIVLVAIAAYILLLFGIVFRVGNKNGNADFFIGDRHSPWWVVAFGMLGASISGVTFVSVPGWVTSTHFTYMQMVLGFIPGYFFVAYVLLPIYYKYNLTSIYGYLELRYGSIGKKTGACFFIITKLLSSAVKLYVVILVLQQLVFSRWNISFEVLTLCAVSIIWLYTFKSGIRAIVWTDFLQTILLIIALVLLLHEALIALNLNVSEAVSLISKSELSTLFVWDDWTSRQNFVRQFISGILIVIVMTGLDQDMMQKNLSCRNLKESRRNMLSYGVLFVPVNLLFLSLGALLVIFYTQNGATLPASGDNLLPYFASQTGEVAITCFVIGMLASSFSSMDSAMTSVTTSVSVDILAKEGKSISSRNRKFIHALVAVLSVGLVIGLNNVRNEHAIDVIYTIVSYLYGPLLGLFSFGLLSRRLVKTVYIPYISIASPIISFGIEYLLKTFFGYAMGYELLLLNGGFVFLGLFLISNRKS